MNSDTPTQKAEAPWCCSDCGRPPDDCTCPTTVGQEVTFDPETGCSYIYLVGEIPEGGAKRQIAVGDNIVLDLDASGAVIGIELLRPYLLHPALLARARRLV